MTTKNTSKYKRWEDIDLKKAKQLVWRKQVKILEATIHENTHKTNQLQIQLVNSFYAKVVAMHKVAKENNGKKTAGIDGIKNLSKKEMFVMLQLLDINNVPSPVIRILIPKPGKKSKRPLGIPVLIDRAQQVLIAMALEPQWEARYSEKMFGFRKGRGAQDALAYTQICLRKAPRQILDADIEGFFDNISHEGLMKRLDAPQCITDAVKRILKAGHMSKGAIYRNKHGTPQGGPLSSTLANIAMTDLTSYVESSHRKRYSSKPPIIIIYADDMIAIHPDLDVITHTRASINAYLATLGLRLSPSKTKICHTRTKDPVTKTRGFDFLGVHFQHVLTNDLGGTKRPYLLATPSKESVKRIKKTISKKVKKCIINRKTQSKRRHLQRKGKDDPVTKLIKSLNSSLRGWANYFRVVNAKKTFTSIDHYLHNSLAQWSKRQFKSKNAVWRYERIFSGIETDHKGNPLLKRDGTPRDRKWAIKSPFVPNEQDHITLCKVADTVVSTHTMTRLTQRYYDNDWLYWGSKSTNYLGIPDIINASALKRTGVKCSRCKKTFSKGDSVKEVPGPKGSTFVHSVCSSYNS